MSEYEINSGGKRYTVQAGSENEARGLVASDQMSEAGAGFLMVIFGPIIVLAIIAIFVQRFALYFISMIVMAALFLVFNKFILKRIAHKLPPIICKFPKIITGAAAVVITFFVLFPMAGNHYAYSVDRANVDEDKIIALANGTPVNLSRRPSSKGNGKTIAVLQAGDKVLIYGATRDRADYKVKTAAGKTGFITRNALAADDMPPRFGILGTSVDKEKRGRRVQALANEDVDALMPGVPALMKSVNISSKPRDIDGGGDWRWFTVKAIGYLDNYTVIQLESDEYDVGNVRDSIRNPGINEGTYYVVKDGTDLDNLNNMGKYTSSARHLIAHREYTTEAGKQGQYLFFEPFDFKRFHLIASEFSYSRLDSGEHVLNIAVR